MIATLKEPVAGFIDNIYGPTGCIVGAGLGFMHTLHADENKIADVVPADYVVNTIIAAAWYIGTARMQNDELTTVDDSILRDDIPIFNYVSCTQKPLTWSEYAVFANKKISRTKYRSVKSLFCSLEL